MIYDFNLSLVNPVSRFQELSNVAILKMLHFVSFLHFRTFFQRDFHGLDSKKVR